MAQHSKTSARIKALIEDLAPPSPPCFDFSNRDAWQTYLASACEASAGESGKWKNHATPHLLGPFIQTDDETPGAWQKNPGWTFCTDCTHSSEQRKKLAVVGRCKPDWWATRTGRVIRLVVIK